MKKYYNDAWKFLQRAFRAALVLALIGAVVALVRDRRKFWSAILEHLPVFLYGLGFFTGYLILYSWYDALGIGVRLMLSLYVPALFTLLWVIDRVGRPLAVPIGGGRSLYIGKIIALVFLAYAITKAHHVFTETLYFEYSGA